MSDDKQWEYARLERTTDPKATDPRITVSYTSPAARTKMRFAPGQFDDELANLSRKGWELVGVVSASPQDDGKLVEYVFKRPHDAGRKILS